MLAWRRLLPGHLQAMSVLRFLMRFGALLPRLIEMRWVGVGARVVRGGPGGVSAAVSA